MTWTTRIIAGLNVLVAGLLFWYVGLSAYKRSEYANNLRMLKETRDGWTTTELFTRKMGDTTQPADKRKTWYEQLSEEDRKKLVDSIVISEDLLAKLPEADAQALRRLQEQKEGEIRRLEAENKNLPAGRRPTKIPHREESDIARRDAILRMAYNPVTRLGEIAAGPGMFPFEIDEDALFRKNAKGEYVGELKLKPRQPDQNGNPNRLLSPNKPDSKDVEAMARLLGFEGFKRLYRESILLHQSRLPAEETELADKKATLLAIQLRYQRDIARFREETDTLKARVETEKELRITVNRENDERRAELARIYSEMAEAFAAREAALGRLRDADRQLQDARDDIQRLVQENERYLQEVSGMETGKK